MSYILALKKIIIIEQDNNRIQCFFKVYILFLENAWLAVLHHRLTASPFKSFIHNHKKKFNGNLLGFPSTQW